MKPSPLCLLLVALFATSLVNALIKPIKPVIDSNRVTLSAGAGLAVNVDTATGLYNVQVDGSTWFNGPLVAFHLNSKCLVMQSSSMDKGTTNFLGAYTSISINWLADSVPITTTFKSYTGVEAIVFEVNFPQGAKNTALGINNDVITAFPHFANISDSLNYLTYSSMFGVPQVDKLNIKNAPGGIEGGPIFAYNSDLRTVAISSLDNFMVAIHEWSASLNHDLSFGINGKVLEFPENYTVSTILFGGQGVRQTVLDWGAALLGIYGKKPTTLDADDLISNLGYWTDDGGYYWYNTEPNKDYQTTIIDVMNYIRNISLPVKNFQLDSWWYFKGKNQGVYTWTPQPSVFPNGIEYVQDNLKIPFAMHNRYFSPDTPYQHNYSMVVEDYCALPQDERLFHDIMALSKSWGNVLYEQDWLITTYEKMNVTQNNVTAGRYWLTSMGAAASSLNMTIQYCMPLVLHLLQSVEVQAVTQARATGDYVPGTTQWLVGYPSMLLWALGLVPFRDDFWSTEIQPNCYNMDGHGTYCNEPNTHLMALTAALTAGPVGPSDSIGKINRDLVMRTAREDGKLLKADFPAMPLDVLFSSTFASPSGAAKTQLWQSSTSISGYTYHYVFSSQLQQPFELQATDLPDVSSSDKFVAFDYYAIYNNVSKSAVEFDATNPLVIPNLGGPGLPNATVQFRYYVVSPVTAPCVILGEFDKFITVSQQRVKSISVTSTQVSVSLIGAPGETVSFWFLKDLSGPLSYVVTPVTLDSDGLGTVSCQ